MIRVGPIPDYAFLSYIALLSTATRIAFRHSYFYNDKRLSLLVNLAVAKFSRSDIMEIQGEIVQKLTPKLA